MSNPDEPSGATSDPKTHSPANASGMPSPEPTQQPPPPHIDPDVREKVEAMARAHPRNMGHALGIRFLSFKRDEVIAEMPVDERTIQPFGLLHGGASVALAETLASIGAWLNLSDERSTAVGLEINANHLRPVRNGGRVIGRAFPIHKGALTQVWEIEIRTPDGKLACKSRCTLAVVNRR